VEVATKELPHIEVQRLAWVQLKYPDRILNECAKVKPDILILQLGSWETAQGVTRYIRTRLDVTSASGGSKSGSSLVEPFVPPVGLSWFIGQTLRTAFDAMLFHQVVDLRVVGKRVDALFSHIAMLKLPAVLVLGALPCPDRVIMRYRKILSAMMEVAALRNGFRFTDVLPIFQTARRAGLSRADLYADRTHLAAGGHVLTGRIVGAEIRNLLNAIGQAEDPTTSEHIAIQQQTCDTLIVAAKKQPAVALTRIC